jgi:cation diffusion facilitator family transporter
MTLPSKHEAAAAGTRTTLVGIIVNVLLAAVKAIAGVVGHSYALLADAIESTSDVFSSLVVLGGINVASRPPDRNHPYGHGKAEPIAAMVVSIALCSAAVFIAVQSSSQILSTHEAPAPFTLFRFVLRTGEATRSTAVRTDAWHHRSDAITSAAAAVGISVALIGGPGYERADDVAALFASGIIAFNGVRLFLPAFHEIMDAAPPPDVERDVRTVAAAVDGVAALEKCFVRKMGFDYFVDLHVEVDGNLTVHQGHAIAHDVKTAIRSALPHVTDVLIHIEPFAGVPRAAGTLSPHS